MKTCVTGCNSLSPITARQASPLLEHLPPRSLPVLYSHRTKHILLPSYRNGGSRDTTGRHRCHYDRLSTTPVDLNFHMGRLFTWPADEHRQKARRSHRSPHHGSCNHPPRRPTNARQPIRCRASSQPVCCGDAPLPVRSQSLTFLASSLEFADIPPTHLSLSCDRKRQLPSPL